VQLEGLGQLKFQLLRRDSNQRTCGLWHMCFFLKNDEIISEFGVDKIGVMLDQYKA
jgi:hypothetical protein